MCSNPCPVCLTLWPLSRSTSRRKRSPSSGGHLLLRLLLRLLHPQPPLMALWSSCTWVVLLSMHFTTFANCQRQKRQVATTFPHSQTLFPTLFSPGFPAFLAAPTHARRISITACLSYTFPAPAASASVALLWWHTFLSCSVSPHGHGLTHTPPPATHTCTADRQTQLSCVRVSLCLFFWSPQPGLSVC